MKGSQKSSSQHAFEILRKVNLDLHELSNPLICKPDPKDQLQLLYLDPKFDNRSIKDLCAQFGEDENPSKEDFEIYMRQRWPFVLSFVEPSVKHYSSTNGDGFCYYNICMQLIYKWKHFKSLHIMLKPDELADQHFQFPQDCEQAVKLLCDEMVWLDDPDDPKFPTNHPFIEDLKLLIRNTINVLSQTNGPANVNNKRPSFVNNKSKIWGNISTLGYLFLHHKKVPFLFFNMLSSSASNEEANTLYYPRTDRAQLIRWKDKFNNYHEWFERSSTIGHSHGHYVTMNDVSAIFQQKYNEFSVLYKDNHFFFVDLPSDSLEMLEKGFTTYCNSLYDYFMPLKFMQEFKWKKDLLMDKNNEFTNHKQYPFGNGSLHKANRRVSVKNVQNLKLDTEEEVQEVVKEDTTNNDKQNTEVEEKKNRRSVLENLTEQAIDQSLDNCRYYFTDENMEPEEEEEIIISRVHKSMMKFMEKYKEQQRSKKGYHQD